MQKCLIDFFQGESSVGCLSDATLDVLEEEIGELPIEVVHFVDYSHSGYFHIFVLQALLIMLRSQVIFGELADILSQHLGQPRLKIGIKTLKQSERLNNKIGKLHFNIVDSC